MKPDWRVESYICIHLLQLKIEIYIYDDGANILGTDIDIRFESPDYDSLDLLREDLINNLITISIM